MQETNNDTEIKIQDQKMGYSWAAPFLPSAATFSLHIRGFEQNGDATSLVWQKNPSMYCASCGYFETAVLEEIFNCKSIDFVNHMHS